MTGKEIVKALRCCAKGLGHDDACENCKVGEIQDRREYIEFAAANVIERLTAENAALREGASLGKVKRPQKIAYEKSIEFLRAVTDGQSDEIKRLRRELEWKDMVIALAQRKQAEAEVERDAAIVDLRIFAGCAACKHCCNHRRYHQESLLLTCCDCAKKQNCKCGSCSLGRSNWEWRGLPKTPEGGDKADA